MAELYEHQLEAIRKMHNGCILCGGVGSGKSRTAIAYYILDCGGDFECNGKGSYKSMTSPRDIYIITTAKKRDSLDWQYELLNFQLYFADQENSYFPVNIVVDSWNNIKKYKNVSEAFFIFDEQRVVGTGAWVKSFLNIARKNRWILLSATPGDTWQDYRPVFIANGFYKNKSDFDQHHVIWARYTTFPKVEGYYDQGVLIKHRNDILVMMKDQRQTVRNNIVVPVAYNKDLYKKVWKDRWDPYDECPIKETGKLFYLLRRVVNSDESRQVALTELLEQHPRTIIFYNFDYELEIIKDICTRMAIPFNEYNGHVHQNQPTGDIWAYIVQYTAASEAWNCITTDTIIFYSLNYSYKVMEQSSGRIDRLNTSYKDLYYYKLKSVAPIDLAIMRALSMKKKFNESSFLKENGRK